MVLLDWRAHGLLPALRPFRRASSKPYVIYCMTENDDADRQRALAGGADDYLLKPFDRQIAHREAAAALRCGLTGRADTAPTGVAVAAFWERPASTASSRVLIAACRASPITFLPVRSVT